MSTYVWLRSSETVQKLLIPAAEKFGKDFFLGRNHVMTDNKTGGKYILVYSDLFDPIAGRPHVPAKYIKRVTVEERHFCTFRTDGLYRLGSATALVKMVVRPANFGNEGERYQDIKISAKSFRQAREIYSQIRQGILKPAESWSN